MRTKRLSRRGIARNVQASGAMALLAICTLAVSGAHRPAAAAELAAAAGMGPSPTLPAPHKQLVPTLKIAPAIGWPSGAKPRTSAGLSVAAFAGQLDHPRWIYVLPNGDVLVAETNAPVRPDDGKGPKAWVTRQFMKKAGASAPSANRIILLRDTDGDGIADQRSVFAEGLNSPLGMVLVGDSFYVANTDAIVRYDYQLGQTHLDGPGTRLTELPAGTINHHWTKNLVASADGKKLYASIGSNSNAAENGIAAEDQRAAILEVDIRTGAKRIFASGLRNPVGMAWEPDGGALWVSVNERDELGDNLVPDYMTSVRDGGFYGWPFSYYGSHVDKRVKPQRPDLVAKALVPDYALGAHTASLGLAAADGNSLGPAFSHGMFVGQHGSWNRSTPSGYQVIYVPFNGPKPQGEPLEVLDGFLNKDGQAMGRPVGVALDKTGALLVADDVGNMIWRVTLGP